MYDDLPHPVSSMTGDAIDAAVPQLHFAPERPTPTAEVLLHALYGASSVGKRLPPRRPDGAARVDLSLARIEYKLVAAVVTDHGFDLNTALGVRAVRLCRQAAAYGNRSASATLN